MAGLVQNIRGAEDIEGLRIRSVNFSYNGTTVLSNIRLSVQEGEFISLLGPSGSGKTTLLRLLAGLEVPLEGGITWKGHPIGGPGIERGVVFQDYPLFPWLSLADNIGLAVGKVNPRLKRAERSELAEQYLAMVGLQESGRKYPFELSGGMQQRGAIARSLALQSPVLLLDEPFGALDPVNRARLQDLLTKVWADSSPRKTVVFVTHDVGEAVILGDRVVVFGTSPGRIIAEFPVRFTRPRSRKTLFSSREFQAVQDEILELYRHDMLERLEVSDVVSGEGEGV